MIYRPTVFRRPVACAAFTAVVGLVVGFEPSVSDAQGTAGAQRFLIVPEESQVIYRVQETLFNENNRLNIAIGVTNAVRGEILVDRANPSQSRIGTITVDISTFRSDSARRDNFIRSRWLESARFPIAEFTPTSVQGVPRAYTDGLEVALQVIGNLKVRTVTRPTTFETRIRLEGNTLTGVATK